MCLVRAFDLLRLIGDTFASAETPSAYRPSSFNTSKRKPAFLRSSLSSLRCPDANTPSTEVREEDNRWRSLTVKASITLGVAGVGNWAAIHLDNLS